MLVLLIFYAGQTSILKYILRGLMLFVYVVELLSDSWMMYLR